MHTSAPADHMLLPGRDQITFPPHVHLHSGPGAHILCNALINPEPKIAYPMDALRDTHVAPRQIDDETEQNAHVCPNGSPAYIHVTSLDVSII